MTADAGRSDAAPDRSAAIDPNDGPESDRRPAPRIESWAWRTWAVATAGMVLLLALATGLGLPLHRAAVVSGAVGALSLVGVRTSPTGPALRDWRVRWALAMHAWVLLLPPTWSDDVFRYLVDGALGAAGWHPFGWAPSSPKLPEPGLRWAAQVNHPELHTIYPPVAQGFFAALVRLGAGVYGFKAAMAAMVMGGAAMAWRMGGVHRRTGLLLLAHPLPLVAATLDAHVDSLALVLLTPIAVGAVRGWPRVAALMGLAAGVKFFPLGLPLALWRTERFRVVAAMAVSALVLAVSYGPLLTAGSKTLGSLGTYAARWEYLPGPAAVVTTAVGWTLQAAGTGDPVEVTAVWHATGRPVPVRYLQGVPTDRAWMTHGELGHLACRMLGLLTLAGIGVWIIGRRPGVVAAAGALTGAVFLWSPVLHPWYLLWLLPWVAGHPAGVGFVWCSVVMLGFWGPAQEQDGAGWADPQGIRVLVWGVPLCWWAIRSRLGSRNNAASERA